MFGVKLLQHHQMPAEYTGEIFGMQYLFDQTGLTYVLMQTLLKKITLVAWKIKLEYDDHIPDWEVLKLCR